MSDGWSYDRYVRFQHDDDDDECSCLKCREIAAYNAYA